MSVYKYLKGVFDEKKSDRITNKVLNIINNKESLYTSFGNDVYFSDLVNNAIDRIASEISKIDVISVVEKNNIFSIQNDDITRLFRFKPNPLQTRKDFLASCEWLRRKDHNCFIYPQYEFVRGKDGIVYKKYTAFYPLNPTKVDIGISGNDVWEVKFYFKDGSDYILPYSDLIHLKWRRGKNMIIGGGNDNAKSDTRDLLRSIEIYDKAIQGLPKAVEASLKINGVYAAKTMMDSDSLKKERDKFEEHIFSSAAGIVATDLAGEFTPVKASPVQLSDSIIKLLKSIIREKYGISEAIISGDYNGDQHTAFYQSCIEEFIVEFEQAFSSCVFSQREQNVGHIVKAYYNKVMYLSTKDKLELAKIGTSVGNMTLDEINMMFGLPPFPGGSRRLQSLNYVNVDLIDQYQLKGGKSSGEKPKEE